MLLFTGFDFEILENLDTILSVLASEYQIDPIRFRDFCYKTAVRYVELYGWYYMPTAAHGILMHGWRVLETLQMPMGMLSEEALETGHQNIKRCRQGFTRKDSRFSNFLMLLITLLQFHDVQYTCTS